MTMEPLRTVLTPVARELLRVSHFGYDVYFRGFLHNHLCHGIVSLTAIVAASTTTSHGVKSDDDKVVAVNVCRDAEIKAHYFEQIKTYESRREPVLTDPMGEITTENWYEHVLHGAGVKMSGNFLNFFDEEMIKFKDNEDVLSHMLTKYVMHPRVVSRLVGGAVHPLIHLGFACELFANEPETSKLLLVEALAMQCTTRDQFGAALDSLEPLSAVNEKEPPLTDDENRVLHVLHRMQQDAALVNVPTPKNPDKVDYIVSRTDVMSQYYNSFPIAESREGVQLAFEHLFFAALAILFGSISTTKHEARLDFFLAHLLTSAVSLRQILPYLDAKAGATLCRYHYCATLVWYRARGRPSLNMERLLKLPRSGPLMTWDACETKLRENPSMEVHPLKVFRALQIVKSEEWAQRALQRGGGGGGGGDGLFPGVTAVTTVTAPPVDDDDYDVWLTCANVLVQNVERDSEFPWLFEEAWDYYNS